MITHLKFAGIPCRDQEAALKFWTEKIGFKVLTDQPLGAQRWIELGLPGGSSRIVLFTPEGHEDRVGSFFNGSFACDNVDATHRQLSERGVTFRQGPTRQPWGVFAIFEDLEGNSFVMGSD